MELDLEEGGRVNIVRAARLQRSKDKQQSGGGGGEGGENVHIPRYLLLIANNSLRTGRCTTLNTKDNNILGRGRLI